MRAPTPYLTPEMIDEILSYLVGDRRTLCKCALVCRVWLPFSTYHLHKSIEVRLRRTSRYTRFVNEVLRADAPPPWIPSIHTLRAIYLTCKNYRLTISTGPTAIPLGSAHPIPRHIWLHPHPPLCTPWSCGNACIHHSSPTDHPAASSQDPKDDRCGVADTITWLVNHCKQSSTASNRRPDCRYHRAGVIRTILALALRNTFTNFPAPSSIPLSFVATSLTFISYSPLLLCLHIWDFT